MTDLFREATSLSWRDSLGKNGIGCVDLFCGAGGLSVGFAAAGFDLRFAVDHDEHAIMTYRQNFGDHAIAADIAQISTSSIPRASIVIGGPPCQGFSRLGKQASKDRSELNSLWQQYVRLVEATNADLFVMENVPNIERSEQHGLLLAQLRKQGYYLEQGILNAADFGVPQRRQRWILMGSRLGQPRLPRPTHSDPFVSDLFERRTPWRTVHDAISDLPLQPNGIDRHDRRNVGPESLERYKHIPPGGCWKDLPQHLVFRCWKERNPRSGGMTDVMGRLRWSHPALTIRTQFLKPEKGCYLHPEAHRAITVREGIRLQTFPDDFAWVGSNFQVVKQAGNAVPPLLAYHIAVAARTFLDQFKHKTNQVLFSLA